MYLIPVLIVVGLMINGSSWPLQKKIHPDGDQLVLDQLKKAGSKLDKPHPVEFFLYLPTEEKARQAAELVKKEGCTVHVELGADKKKWLCFATKKMVPKHAELERLRKRFDAICAKFGGEYDGWGTPVIK
jgi:cytosine/adenosine deaminase-related metal-dependent hydrolase